MSRIYYLYINHARAYYIEPEDASQPPGQSPSQPPWSRPPPHPRSTPVAVGFSRDHLTFVSELIILLTVRRREVGEETVEDGRCWVSVTRSRTVQVGRRKFKVLTHDKCIPGRGEDVGVARLSLNTIELRELKDERVMNLTFVHELLHAINDEIDAIPRFFDGDEDAEEQYVSEMARMLFSVDNIYNVGERNESKGAKTVQSKIA